MTRTVLVVEDTDLCRDALELSLTKIPGLAVRMVGTAEEALQRLGTEEICALVTDLHLPSMDGFELIEAVRAQPGRAGLPILVISGDSDLGTPARVASLGADAYFAKPYSPSEVRSKLERLLDANYKDRYYGVWLILVLLLFARDGHAEDQTGMQQILQRLDRLEQENRTLSAEVGALRSELAAARGSIADSPSGGVDERPAAVPLEERVAVEEQRTADQAQTKVEAAHRLPITLTGMVLFNAFLNGRSGGGQQDPVAASSLDPHSGSGASLSQSLLGFTFQGPTIAGGGVVSGQLHLDLWGGTFNSLNHLMRLRVATIAIDWKNQSIVVGQDKPIVSPRDPTSLAQVAVSPLAAAGNPWLWQPQVRFEQRFALGENAGIRARAGVYQTSESTSDATSEYASTLSAARPGVEGRFEFWRKFGEHARVEIAPGFHTSETHVAGVSVPSRLFTLDWLIQPMTKVQFTGLFFTGENASVIGGLRGGFTIFSSNLIQPVSATGGWAQLSYLATDRLTFNFYGGQESHNAADLLPGEITRNFEYAGNAIYKLGSNVLLGLEASQVRTSYLQQSNRLVNHYDLALGYLF